jgi:hypothetical protein
LEARRARNSGSLPAGERGQWDSRGGSWFAGGALVEDPESERSVVAVVTVVLWVDVSVFAVGRAVEGMKNEMVEGLSK